MTNLNLYLPLRIQESIEILKMYEPAEGYYLAFSGGKDSMVLYEIAQKANVRFDGHYNITSADPPELVRFIRQYYPNVRMEKPGITMWELIPRKMMPPTRLVRYCCQFLKERGGEGRVVLTGVKKSDSVKRRNIMVSTCQAKGKVVVAPLINWNDSEIWEYIKSNNLSYCRLYDEGFSRLGCVGCPLAGPNRQRLEFERWPKFRAAYLRAFERMLVSRRKRGLQTNWQTGEEVMRWWLKEN